MAPLLDSMVRQDYLVGIARIAVLAVVVFAVAILASVAFDWTLASGPSCELTTNPGADLPF